jgi:3-phosphoshikimate 1-carboxyvinyltransferase
MTQYLIKPSRLSGRLVIPSSKSHTLRALTFALMAKGVSHIRSYLQSPDTNAMIKALRFLGAVVDVVNDEIAVDGTAGNLKSAEDVIDCGNSGQVLRFIGALSALMPTYTILTGDRSIRHNRPIIPLLDGLTQLGAFAVSSRGDGFAPIILRGPLTKDKATVLGVDSQPVSGLLIAASFAHHPIVLHVEKPGEKPWIGLTLHWFEKFGIPYANENFERYALQGNAKLKAFDYIVPGDFSSAAFPIAAALVTHSELTIFPIDMDDPQGDKAIIPLLQKMGAAIEIDARDKTLTVKKGGRLKGARIDCNDFIDALPILAVIGCFADGETEIVNAAIARSKESDRIHCIATELIKMGADIEERPDGLKIRQSKLRGAKVETHHDHRLVLALSVAAMGAASGESVIGGTAAAEKTYPGFLRDFQRIGANIEAIR